MNDDLVHSENKKVNSKFLRNLLSENLTKIKNIINHKLRNLNSKEKEDLTLDTVKRQFEELKAKKVEFERYEKLILIINF